MKKLNLMYWIATGLFAAFMIFSAIPDIMKSPEAVAMITGLGYPEYFVRFIGIVKIFGVIGILVPGFPRITEWAYAGLFYDLFGATVSIIIMQGFQLPMLFMVLPFGFLFLSYFLYHKRRQSLALQDI